MAPENSLHYLNTTDEAPVWTTVTVFTNIHTHTHTYIHTYIHTEEFMDMAPENSLHYLNTTDEAPVWTTVTVPSGSDSWPVARAWHGMAHVTNTSQIFVFGGRTGENYGMFVCVGGCVCVSMYVHTYIYIYIYIYIMSVRMYVRAWHGMAHGKCDKHFPYFCFWGTHGRELWYVSVCLCVCV